MPGKDKFAGALLGTFTGDALGMPVEGWDHDIITSKYGEIRDMLEARLGRGTYTDDTELMIGVAESLIKNTGFNGPDMARALAENCDVRRGYGGGALQTLSLIKKGVEWYRAGAMVFSGGSFGNGASMRIAPVGCLYYNDPGKLIEVARGSSYITHQHPLGLAGAVLQARAVSLAVGNEQGKLDVQNFIYQLKDFIKPISDEYVHVLKQVEKLIENKEEHGEVITTLGNGVQAHKSVCTAIYAFLSNHTSFENALVCAVGLGGDTDTIGAMCGAIAGGYHGKNAIPGRWLDVLENGYRGKDHVEKLAGELWDLHKEINSR
ncbi:MAG: ADP-ribosylglycohydrolase family protein [Clostridiales bacterium]|nr:ADP-ribosylglycohydrolase family protein [Clostridiales bacterium]MCF8022747.1 ADP-ribosylglycohydrolase family protein [Clostridiales bacterium]